MTRETLQAVELSCNPVPERKKPLSLSGPPSHLHNRSCTQLLQSWMCRISIVGHLQSGHPTPGVSFSCQETKTCLPSFVSGCNVPRPSLPRDPFHRNGPGECCSSGSFCTSSEVRIRRLCHQSFLGDRFSHFSVRDSHTQLTFVVYGAQFNGFNLKVEEEEPGHPASSGHGGWGAKTAKGSREGPGLKSPPQPHPSKEQLL